LVTLVWLAVVLPRKIGGVNSSRRPSESPLPHGTASSENDYRDAWDEWASSADAELWSSTVGDGLYPVTE
jgi:hypothetical protein